MSRVGLFFSRWWAIFAHLAGVGIISFGIAWGALVLTARDGPVVERVGKVEVITPAVPYRGSLRYSYDTKRHESCPGEVVYTATSQTNHGPQAVVTFRRALRSVEISNEPIEARAIVVLPESMFPAVWRFVSAVHSRCPTRERVDIMVEFDFEVTK